VGWKGRRTGADATAKLVAFYQDGKGKQLPLSRWTVDGVVERARRRYAYAWALAVVENN